MGQTWDETVKREKELEAKCARYRQALEKIADTDPDDLQVFHDIANKALNDA